MSVILFICEWSLVFVNPELFVITWASGLENGKPGFGFGFFLHLPVASVKAPEYGPQCPFDWIEVCCIVTGPTTCSKDRQCHVYRHCSCQLQSAD